MALTYEVKIVKPQNVQLPGLQGVCGAPDCMDSGGGGGRGVETYLYPLACRHVWLFVCMLLLYVSELVP